MYTKDKNNDPFEIIQNKIHTIKETYPFLRKKSDDIAFTALCVKANFYKNPNLILNEMDIANFLVDSSNDGGVDALLSDPNSETSDLIICQAKHYKKISFDDVRDAVAKMISFFKAMKRGEYETVNSKVQKRFLDLYADVGDESKVCFVFYTSAPKSGIREDRIKKLLLDNGLDDKHYEIDLYFDNDIIEEIKESESRRPTVESGKINIDRSNNVLWFNDNAAIVNVSAFSIKELYAQHNTNLLSRNLRYFIRKSSIDTSINDTIDKNPETFWYKNNGLTIICDDFDVSGTLIKLSNFSIVNGGQTATLLHKNKNINKLNDFYLPCKIIKNIGESEHDKYKFSVEIATATNAQKAIKPSDLKSNAPEQIRFSIAMRNAGIFYQTKRGEDVPKNYKEIYLNTNLSEVGKLCLAAIFQLPATSRSNPSSLYSDRYYHIIFNSNQDQIAFLVKELLYMDAYFKKTFIHKFDAANEDSPNATELIPFAHNARTICIAFAALASRVYYKNITTADLRVIFENINRDRAYEDYYYNIFRNIDGVNYFFHKKIFSDKDLYDEILYKLYSTIIISGRRYYSVKKEADTTLDESNFLKKDNNYYLILKSDWDSLYNKIQEIFQSYIV